MWGFGVLPLSCPGPLGRFFHRSEAIGMPDVALTGFSSVTVLVTRPAGCGLEEVEMVGKERTAGEAGGDGNWSAVGL